MFGKPKDIEGKCNAKLYIADDHGDGEATMRCQLDEGHEGEHKEVFQRGGEPVTITWGVDESEDEDEDWGDEEDDLSDIL